MKIILVLIIILQYFAKVRSVQNEKNLQNYKNELRRISSDVEDFIFDLAKEAFKNADSFFTYNETDDDDDSNTITKSEEIDSTRKKRSNNDEFVGLKNVPNYREPIEDDKNLSEIKEELKKVNDLFQIVKDQQTILSILEKKNESALDSKLLLKVLEHINNSLNEEKELSKKLPTQKELEQLKLDLKRAIFELNRTKSIIIEDKHKKSLLEFNLNRIQEEVNQLKEILKERENQKSKDVVGAPLYLPKELPKLKETNSNNTIKNQTNSNSVNKTTTRSSLLDLLDADRPKNFESELKDIMRKWDEKESVKKEMVVLEKLLDLDKRASKTISDDDISLVKRLLEGSGEPQSKSDDIIDELKKLESAINILRPEDSSSILSGKEQPLNKGTVTLTIQQIVELRKKLDEIINTQAKKDIQNILSIGDLKYKDPNEMLLYPPWYRPYDLTTRQKTLWEYPYGPNYFNPYFPPLLDYYGSTFSTPTQFKPGDLEGYLPPSPTQHQDYYYQGKVGKGSMNIKVMSDLKNEIDTLEKTIGKLKFERNIGPMGDKSTLSQLEREVQGLKNIINGLKPKADHKLNLDEAKPTELDFFPNRRQKRSRDLTSETKKSPEDSKTDLQLFDDLTAQLRESIVVDNNESEITNSNARNVDELTKKINQMKAQLGVVSDNYYKQSNNDYGYENMVKFPLTPLKKDDLFTDILLKIIDKLLAALPKIMGKLFGDSIEKLVYKIDYDKNQYNSNYVSSDYYNNNLETIFYNLGSFGYIPLIILKLLNACSSFFGALKTNKFFRNFLVPGFVLLIVSGAVLFTIWWFNDDDSNVFKQINFDRNSQETYDKYRAAPVSYSVTAPYYYYGNPYKYFYPYAINKAAISRTVNNMPGSYYRTYFDTIPKDTKIS